MKEYRWIAFNDEAQSLYSYLDTKPHPSEPTVEGWIHPNENGTWLARTNDGLVREFFPTKEEAREFLWGICHMRSTT